MFKYNKIIFFIALMFITIGAKIYSKLNKL